MSTTLMHYLPPSAFIWAACAETEIRNGTSDIGKVTCFACRQSARFKADRDAVTDVRPSVPPARVLISIQQALDDYENGLQTSGDALGIIRELVHPQEGPDDGQD